MFDGLVILGLIGVAKQLFNEATEYKPPANARIDWQKVDEDYMLPASEQKKRWHKGYYHTTEPLKMFDLQMYKEDVLAGASPDELERNRLSGKYGAEKPFGYDYKANYSTRDLISPYIVDVVRYEYCRRKHPEWFKNNYLSGTSYEVLKSPSCWKQYL